jgi:hypothetical protein
MAYIFTAITGGQNVGQAFTRVNQNLAAIEGNQGGGNFLPLSGGTLTGGLSGITFALGEGSYFNTLSSSTLTANRIVNLPNKNGTVALLNDLTGFTTGNFVPLTGTSLGSEITGDIEITNSNTLRIKDGTDVNSVKINISNIDFRDDYNAVKTSLQYTPLVNSNAVINIIDTLPDGYMVIASDPSGQEGKSVIVNSSGNGWEYVDITGSFVKNTGDTITGLYTINDGPVDGAQISLIGGGPIIYMESDGLAPVVRLVGTDVIGKAELSNTSLVFDNNQSGGQLSSLQIRPLIYDITGSSILDIIKPTGNTNGYFVTVGNIVTKSNEVIKINNAGTGFDTIAFSGSGSVGVTYSPTSITIIGSGATRVESAGTGNRLLISSITNNNIVQKSLSGGTNVTITETNGTLVFSSTGGSSTGITTASTVGSGVSLISAITNNNLQLNSISGTAGMVVNAASNGLITFRGPTTANRVFMTDASGNMVNSDFLFTDNTNDTLGINVAAATTARLLISTQTAAIAPLRFTKSTTDYTGAVDGSIWYLTSGDSLKFRKNLSTTDFIFKDNNQTLSGATNNRILQVDSGGTLSAIVGISNFGVFNMLTSVTITDTTSETSILNTGTTVFNGTNVLNSSSHVTAPQLVTGKKFRFTANGTIATHSSAGNLTARMKLGNTVIASISGFSLHDSISSPNNFFIESSFTIRTQGVSGTVIGGGSLNTDHKLLRANPDGNSFVGLNNLGSVTLDTTSDRAFDFTFQFGTASGNNVITINEATLEYLN